jgi:hypothetical protein
VNDCALARVCASSIEIETAFSPIAPALHVSSAAPERPERSALITMLRTSILLCTASAAALSLVESPAVNDYELVATGKDCPQDGRINLPCGNCGPNVSVALTRTIFRTLLRTAHALCLERVDQSESRA